MPSDEPKMIRLPLVAAVYDELLPLLDELGQPLRRRDGRRLVVVVQIGREGHLARLHGAGRGFLLGFVDRESPAPFQFDGTRLAGDRRLQNDRLDAERERAAGLPIHTYDAEATCVEIKFRAPHAMDAMLSP